MAEPGENLSGREIETLQAVAEGLANKEIATKLFISPNTVKVHLRNIYTKLGASSRTEAVTMALQQGLITLAGPDEAAEEGSVDQAEPDAAAAMEGETAVSPSVFPLNRSAIALIAIILFVASLIGFISWRALSEPTPPTPEPFVEEPIGETRWLHNRPMPEGRVGMAAAAVGLDVYAIGGETAVGVTNSVAVYDTGEHIWREAAAKPTAVSDVTAAVLFGEIYVPGGKLESGEVTAVVEAYSPANDAWRPIAALPQPLAGGLTLTDGSFLYLFGGWDGDAYLDSVYVYDPAGDSWGPLEPMTQPRAYTAGAFMTGEFFIVGGLNEKPLAMCQAYDPVAATWTDCPDMLLSRVGAGAAALLNKLYVIGGDLNETDDVTYSEFYDPASQKWQVVNTPPQDEQSTWSRLGVTNVETRVYVLGGRRNGFPSKDTLVYSPFVYQTFIPAAAAGSKE